MDKKNFDLALVRKINLLIQNNANNDSPFEWFVVGFLYAHPHNIQSLNKIFVDVHNVISLHKTNHFLTSDDTHEILIKMINNLINSQINANINKKPEITLSSDGEKQKAKVGKSSPNKNKAKPLVINGDSPNIDVLLNSAEVNKKSATLGVSKSTRIPEDDDISYNSEEQFKPQNTRSSVQSSEDLFNKDNKAKKASVSSKKSPIKSSESLISSLKSKDKTAAAGKKSTTKDPPPSSKQFDIFEDDISFESDNDLKPSKTRNAQKQEEQKKPSTSKAKLVSATTDKSPVKTPNKGGFKFTNHPPEPTKEQIYLEDDHSYESENNLIQISTKKESTPNNKSGKASMIKEEQEVNHKLTASYFAQRVQKKSVTKDPPKSERKKSGDTEDLIVSEPEETKSLIARQAQVKAGKKSVDRKNTEKDLIEEEFNGSDSFGTSAAELISAMQKRTSNAYNKQSKVKKEKDEDSWGTPFEKAKNKEGSNNETLSQKKQKAVKLDDVMGNLIISLEDDTPIEQEISMNSRFKKQRVHQPDEFEMTLEVDPKVKEAPSSSRKPKLAQLIDDSDCIQLVETPPESPKQIYFTKKSMNKGSTAKDDIELIEEPVTFTRKPIDKVQVDQPKSAKELRDVRRLMSPEEEEKLSKAYIEKLQLEEKRGIGGNKRKKQ